MGRKKLNRTPDEIKDQNRIRRKRHYDNHQEAEQQKSLARFHKKKQLSLANEPFIGSIP